MDIKQTSTTRYLCAAAHLDPAFCDAVIQQLIEEDHKAIGLSYGVDLPTILMHCLVARRRRDIRDITIAILFIISLFSVNWRELSVLTWYLIYLNPFFVISFAIIFAEAWYTRYGILLSSLSRGKFKPDAMQFKLHGKSRAKIAAIDATQTGNVVVYSGFTPFVGAGYDIGGWSFSIRVDKGKEDIGGQPLQPLPIDVMHLYQEITDEVLKLGLNELSISDKVFINGREVRYTKRFLPDPFQQPVADVELPIIEKLMMKSTSSVRYYKCFQIVSWKGDLVLSVFLRFQKLSESLFIEASYFLLPPVKEEYRKIDSMQPLLSMRSWLVFTGKTLMTSLIIFPTSFITLIRRAFSPIARWNQDRPMRRVIREDLTFDYGASSSIRSLASSIEYQHYFQRLDKEMYIKIVERQILDTLVSFLDGKNIDTSDLKNRQTTILNNGVIMSGGKIQAGSFAVGELAKSIVNQVTGQTSSNNKTD